MLTHLYISWSILTKNAIPSNNVEVKKQGIYVSLHKRKELNIAMYLRHTILKNVEEKYCRHGASIKVTHVLESVASAADDETDFSLKIY